MGDLNGDGALDLVYTNRAVDSQVYLNDRHRGFLGPRNLPGSRPGPAFSDTVISDLNGDGALDIIFASGDLQAYINDGYGDFILTASSLPSSDLGRAVTVGDLNGDGWRDLLLSTFADTTQIYFRPAIGQALPNRPPSIVVGRPGPTPAADFFSTPAILSGPTIPISYTLIDRESDPVREVRAFYSLDGGGSWHPALAATGTITQALATSPAGVPHIFNWDVYSSGFFGASDNVVVRLVAIPDPRPLPNSAAGPFLYGSAAAATFPFRVRGSQVRVVQQGVPVDPPSALDQPYHAYLPLIPNRPNGSTPTGDRGALVYRIKPGQLGTPLLNPDGQPARTLPNGYLGGRDSFTIGDQLVALKPIAATDTYTVYLTSAAPSPSGLDAYTVRSPGVQTLTVSADHPLVLFNLSLALEWDARADQQYQAQLEADLKRTSELLFSWTKGQAALGNITVYHDKQHWDTANIQIAASNQVRPNAAVGGLGTGGQIRIGAIWNRYGEARGTLGEDWPRALAHELGHYAFDLEDNYLGLNQGRLVLIDSCPGVMSNPYRADQGFYRPTGDWLPDCKQTLSNQRDGRSDWQTIVDQLPWLHQPAATLAAMPIGPSFLPLAVTQVSFVAPTNTNSALEATLANLTAQNQSIEPGARARAFLFQCPAAGSCANDQWGRLIDLGSPTLHQVQVRGARPGDRLCVYDLDARDARDVLSPRLGCAPVAQGNMTLDLRPLAKWPPDITITPLNSTSVRVTAANIPPGASLKARLYPTSGAASVVQPLDSAGMATFTLSQPALDGYVHIWADEPAPRREIVVAYGLGGGPVRRSIGRGDAPVLSPDGQVILFGPNLKFAPGQFYTLQAATNIPSRPPGGRLVGQAYRLNASAGAPDLSNASINFSYLGRDVPAGQNNPDWIKIYYSVDGSGWQALPTDVDIATNNAVAPTRGPGLYALIIGIEIPLFQGVNYIVYPVQDHQPVRQALRSINGVYTLVSTTSPGDGGHHSTFDPSLSDTDPRNTLKQLRFGNVYAITVSRNVTLRLDAGGGGTASAPATQAAAADWAAPVTYDRPLAAEQGATSGLPVVVRVNGAICGGGHTYERNGRLRAIVQVAGSAQHAICSDTGQPLMLTIGSRGSLQFLR